MRVASRLKTYILGNQETRKLRNQEKLGKSNGCLGIDRAGRPFFLPEIRLWSQQLKITRKQISKFLGPLPFCLISLLCLVYFPRLNLFKNVVYTEKNELITFDEEGAATFSKFISNVVKNLNLLKCRKSDSLSENLSQANRKSILSQDNSNFKNFFKASL